MNIPGIVRHHLRWLKHYLTARQWRPAFVTEASPDHRTTAPAVAVSARAQLDQALRTLLNDAYVAHGFTVEAALRICLSFTADMLSTVLFHEYGYEGDEAEQFLDESIARDLREAMQAALGR